MVARCLQQGSALFKKKLIGENGWGKNEKQFPCWGNPWLALHPASNVLNIYVSLHDHEWILLSSR
jgi:hypothetical protein